jgi:hypothetical protein
MKQYKIVGKKVNIGYYWCRVLQENGRYRWIRRCHLIFSIFKAATLVKLLVIFSGAFKKGTTNKTRTISAAS